jgi:hypothetical protein
VFEVNEKTPLFVEKHAKIALIGKMRRVMENSTDWIVDPNGFYIATRSFLIRRGYCCANQCRNCPYINWHDSPRWQPLESSMIQNAAVSPKAIAAAKKALAYHEQQAQQENQVCTAFHQAMLAHYRSLLQHWTAQSR